MRIGFFSADRSAFQTALLANSVFNRNRLQNRVHAYGSSCLGAAVPGILDRSRERNDALMLAMPLASLQDWAIRGRLDLAVVTAGGSAIHAADARAAVARDGRQGPTGIVPAWLLAGTQEPITPGLRRLPGSTTPLSLHETVGLRSGCSCGRLHRRAIGLAAVLRIAADDPFADRIDPEETARLIVPEPGLSPAPTHADPLRNDLLDLAAELDEPVPAIADRRRRSSPARGLAPRQRPGHAVHRRSGGIVVVHERDCAHATAQ